MRSRTVSLYWTTCLFILNCLIQAGRYRTCSVSAASTKNEKQHNLHYWHSRSKRTPPIPFPFLPPRRFGPPMLPTEATGPIGLPGSPLLRSFPPTGLSPFGNELEPTRFGRPVVGREVRLTHCILGIFSCFHKIL